MNVFDKFLNAIRLNDDFDEDDEYFEDEPVEETPKKTKEKKSFFAKKQDFEDDLDDLDAVSYTHLDVYKRQLLGWDLF